MKNSIKIAGALALLFATSPALAFILRDADTGDALKIDGDGHASVDANIATELHHASEEDSKAYTWANVTYDYDANDTILLLENNANDELLFIHNISISADITTRVTIHIGDTNIAPAGTTVTGSNLNLRSGNVAEATARGDETVNSQGNVIWQGVVLASTTLDIDFDSAVILGNNDTIGVDFVADGTAAYVTITGFFE